MPETAVLLPPLDMHARKPSRYDYVYALCDAIEAEDPSPALREAVESLGDVASFVSSPDRHRALNALRRIRAVQLRA